MLRFKTILTTGFIFLMAFTDYDSRVRASIHFSHGDSYPRKKLNYALGSRTIRKSAKVVTMSLEGGLYPLSLAFGGKFSHKLDHFWPN